MDNKNINNTEEIEIDLQRLFGALLNKAWLVGLVAVVCAVATFLGTFFFVTPLYESDVKFYVNNSSSVGDVSVKLTNTDISAAKSLVDTYIVILNTRQVLNDVIDYAGVDYTYSQIKSMISAGSVSSTEVFKVVVTSPDPLEAKKIADAIAYILPKQITTIIDGTSTKVADAAVTPVKASSPSYSKNAVIGFLVGMVATMAVIVILDLLNTSVRTEEDIERSCDYPVLAAVPDMTAPVKGGYYGAYGKKKQSYAKPVDPDAQPVLVGAGISFAAAEAYKLLRTKLQFSFADEGGCRVIGVSGALTGEGKSLSAVNLAFAFSQLGKRVLLVGCDMRRPSLPNKLRVKKTPGLSNYLSGQTGAENLIQLCGLEGDERAFHVITAGQIPPNPVELLSSVRMEKLTNRLRESYDYILLDLPPVGEVSDALAVAGITDGMLLVVRQNECDRNVLGAAVRQFEFVGAKILGVVFNCVDHEDSAYGKKKYYYGKGYAHSAKKAEK